MGRKQNKRIIELTVNGDDYELAIEPQETLLEVLRNSLALTGAKEGCGTGECGTCTVLIDGEPMLSCLMLAVLYAGHDTGDNRFAKSESQSHR